MAEMFHKSFTQQEPIPKAAIARAVPVIRSGHLHRCNLEPGEAGAVAELERASCDLVGQPRCLAVSSGGQAIQIALRAAGIGPGGPVLTTAFTLAPLPGAITLVGAEPVLVETTDQLRPDLSDLDAEADASEAKAPLLSNMRGHLPDMEVVGAICARHGLILIEDCAHAFGATRKGRASGTFGQAGCHSTQTNKHVNPGEGGLIVSADAATLARATILSGSHMLYARHGAGPDERAFAAARYQMANGSARMDAVRAAILLDQIATLPDRIKRWAALYRAAAAGLAVLPGVTLPRRPQVEGFVGPSIQFLVPPGWSAGRTGALVAACAARGVDLKRFDAAEPRAHTSRFDQWYFAPQPALPQTMAVLCRLFEIRLPLTFEPTDCAVITRIIAEEFCREWETAT